VSGAAGFQEPDFRATAPGACDACGNTTDEARALIGRLGEDFEVEICARCMKGALALLRGLGLTP